MSLLSELKRRNVFRVATFYAVAGWVLLQAGDLLFDALGVPPWALKLLLGLLLLGFPLAIFFAWAFELTPEGLKREHEVHPDASITAQTATKLNALIVGLLVVAIGLGVANWLGHANDDGRTSAEHLRAQTAPAGDGRRSGPGKRRNRPRGRLHRRAAVRQHERRKGQRVFFGWPDRRTAERAGERAGTTCDRAHLLLRLQGQGR